MIDLWLLLRVITALTLVHEVLSFRIVQIVLLHKLSSLDWLGNRLELLRWYALVFVLLSVNHWRTGLSGSGCQSSQYVRIIKEAILRTEWLAVDRGSFGLYSKLLIVWILLITGLDLVVLLFKYCYFHDEQVQKLRLSCVFDFVNCLCHRCSTNQIFVLKLTLVLFQMIVDWQRHFCCQNLLNRLNSAPWCNS